MARQIIPLGAPVRTTSPRRVRWRPEIALDSALLDSAFVQSETVTLDRLWVQRGLDNVSSLFIDIYDPLTNSPELTHLWKVSPVGIQITLGSLSFDFPGPG